MSQHELWSAQETFPVLVLQIKNEGQISDFFLNMQKAYTFFWNSKKDPNLDPSTPQAGNDLTAEMEKLEII